jgi:hypothetical protein
MPGLFLDEPNVEGFVAERRTTKGEVADISDAAVSIKVPAVKP